MIMAKKNKNSKKLSNNGRPADRRLITDETQDHIWQCFIRGLSYRLTTVSYNREYKDWLKERGKPKGISWQSIQKHSRAHLKDYDSYREDKKQERLAAERARIAELTDQAEERKKEIVWMKENLTPQQRVEARYLETIKEFRATLEQIATDSGDRTDKGKDDSNKPSTVILIENHIPGVWAGDNEHSSSKQNSRFNLDKL